MSLYYTTFEAAQVLGVSLPTVVNWIKARRIKAHRTPGGHRRIAREDLAGFMLRQGIPLPAELSDAVPARRKVLVIAEGGPAREGTTRQLAQAGFAVEQVSPGFAAGAAAARFGPEAIVLHAGSQDGGDTLRGLKSRPRARGRTRGRAGARGVGGRPARGRCPPPPGAARAGRPRRGD
ncbi:MAG: helix-turn-helix domain-containing protein [Anaeromyxobacteraceae bacterium]